jgi:hypothetical protein
VAEAGVPDDDYLAAFLMRSKAVIRRKTCISHKEWMS